MGFIRDAFLLKEDASDEAFDEAFKVKVPEGVWWKKLLAYLGPGFLVCIAYIDPANFESDIQAGSTFEYELGWILLLSTAGGVMLQMQAASLGIVTGKHLALHCRLEYPKPLNYLLWIIAEIEIVASDIPEVIGTAMALNLLFGLPIWIGVLITGTSTLVFLGIQRFGVRKLEFVVTVMVFIMAGCYFTELYIAKPRYDQIALGLVYPRLRNSDAVMLAVSLVGAEIMPHNLFLHSSIVLSRNRAQTDEGIKDGCHYCLIETSIAVILAFFINVSVVSLGGVVCHESNLSPRLYDVCQDLNINNIPDLLQHTLGSWASPVFGVALLASGQSSTITGTYAGQYVMQGFLNLRMKTWLRNLLTRLAAIVPALLVSVYGGEKSSGKLIIICSMILSFGLPFSLVPLLKFTSSSVKMGPFKNSWRVTVGTWLMGLAVLGINVYYMVQKFIEFMHKDLPLVFRIFCAIMFCIIIVCYISILIYLAVRNDVVVTAPILLPTIDSQDSLKSIPSGVALLPLSLSNGEEVEDTEKKPSLS
eukprot:TRINITY_DN4148_c0_g1_i1.p1 TRINITY_DN4148_c0_g1~~TRINITY_DN4148_c0_g1_i1.p1  ORF type:complete len:532 (-),score=107.61 TRINITY_DN4148_c0_g1_i1:197-1792(-)